MGHGPWMRGLVIKDSWFRWGVDKAQMHRPRLFFLSFLLSYRGFLLWTGGFRVLGFLESYKGGLEVRVGGGLQPVQRRLVGTSFHLGPFDIGGWRRLSFHW